MDQTARANAAIGRELAAASVPRATCRDCGSRNVAWVQSKRTSKWYLADAHAGVSGKVIPQPREPHFKRCGDGWHHPAKPGSDAIGAATRTATA